MSSAFPRRAREMCKENLEGCGGANKDRKFPIRIGSFNYPKVSLTGGCYTDGSFRRHDREIKLANCITGVIGVNRLVAGVFPDGGTPWMEFKLRLDNYQLLK